MNIKPFPTDPAFQYRWTWSFRADPERVWPLIADTQRFNEATGLPPTQVTETPDPEGGVRRTMRFRRLGMWIVWDEQPFEWVRPKQFGVLRVYRKGPVAWMRTTVRLDPRTDGGTDLTYEVQVHPADFLGYLIIPIQVNRLSRKAFDRVFRQIDVHLSEQAQSPQPFPLPTSRLKPAAETRCGAIVRRLVDAGHDPALVARLENHLRTTPDTDLSRLRPFTLADAWGADRIRTLELFLRAAKFGLLDVNWDLLCPECRGAKSTAPTLANIDRHVHCSSCNIDYEVNFDQNVEVTFHPNPAIKPVDRMIFCAGGPQNTPHIIAQQALGPGERRTCGMPLGSGRYRIRGPRAPRNAGKTGVSSHPGQETYIDVAGEDSPDTFVVTLFANGLHPTACTLHTGEVSITIDNKTKLEQVLILEQTVWSNQAATAAQVTTLQAFRDLFSSEALRPREQIAVTSLTILFTDIKGSTAMYRKIGDAPAFGHVMDHFAILRDSIARHNGSVVKTIGDAVMGAFADPADGVVAAIDILGRMREYNAESNHLPLPLKMGLHQGPCIAITLNDRLDYFGSTVNIAARIEAQSDGGDFVISETIFADPGGRERLEQAPVEIVPFTAELRGYNEPFSLYRIRSGER